MTLPPLCSAALFLFALAGAIVGWAYRHAEHGSGFGFFNEDDAREVARILS